MATNLQQEKRQKEPVFQMDGQSEVFPRSLAQNPSADVVVGKVLTLTIVLDTSSNWGVITCMMTFTNFTWMQTVWQKCLPTICANFLQKNGTMQIFWRQWKSWRQKLMKGNLQIDRETWRNTSKVKRRKEKRHHALQQWNGLWIKHLRWTKTKKTPSLEQCNGLKNKDIEAEH